MSARLSQIVAGLAELASGAADPEIRDVEHDSRRVGDGCLFVALRGERSDGHDFAAAAVRSGAAALLVERDPGPLPRDVPVARARDTRAALGPVAARVFGEPARELTLIGVTGTNGKSSTVRMIEAIARGAGLSAGSLGTISLRFPDAEEPAALTTPEATDTQRNLARMRDAGARWVAMEVSSHALAADRVRGLRFDAGVFTHLSQDHLDFHGDMDRYADAKGRLFDADYLAGPAILNAADPRSRDYAARARAAGQKVFTWARGEGTAADLRTCREHVALDGARMCVEDPSGRHALRLPLPGDFQVENALAAACTACALGLDWDEIATGLAACPPVPGRLERVSDEDPAVLVDYAHTPGALDSVLSRVRPLVRGRLICVFGCGGDRDRTKRAPMARAACAHADRVYATSDNPRSEDPEAILRDVAAGLSGDFRVIADRRSAIRAAVAEAAPEDCVVIAGKGHEDYQIVGERRLDFDDRVEGRAALDARRGAS